MNRQLLVARSKNAPLAPLPQALAAPVHPAALQAAPSRFSRVMSALSSPAPAPATRAGAEVALVKPADVVPAPAPRSAPNEPRSATIACIIPAYNEEATIAATMDSLLRQTRLPDVIHVVVNNTDDDTLDVLAKYEGEHEHVVKGRVFRTTVVVHDIGENPDKKVGALNYGFQLAREHDFILGVDGDTTLERRCVEWLELEMVDDPRIGGLSAVYSIDADAVKGFEAKFLVAGQRAQFAGFNMDNLLRGRNMAVLGGQCSLFSVEALEAVMLAYHQNSPWVRDSEVEDSLLSLQVKRVGFATKISARARAFVGPMESVRGLHGQQVKWNYGAIDLMWPGQRNGTTGQPFHPNLRLRWRENATMLLNVLTRVSFLLLLTGALSIGAFVFNPLWLIPPAVAMLLNLRIALSMHDRSAKDLGYAFLAVPAELYMWLRMSHFATAWARFLARVERDNWAAQAAAEKGQGGSAWAYPLLLTAGLVGVTALTWTHLDTSTQSNVLSVGWPVLYLVTILQTVFMLKKLLRRQRGFTV
jgi:cellulose synthase/poly-beta-1,6-N-acetylglucosamine synthase-like glycosyltransferase